MKPELFISVDVEASGPIPGEYSMLSLGAAVVGEITKNFYVELKPISEKFVAEALKVSQFSLEELQKTGADPAAAMKFFEDWIRKVSDGKRPVFVAFNATFDWQFINYYFHRFLGRNPFGISGLDIKAYYMGKKSCSWGETAKRRFDTEFLSGRKHTHNARDDAIEQAEIMEKLLEKKKT